MRRSQSSSEHAEAVSRRLATLSAELAAVRGEPDDADDAAHGHTRVRERPGLIAAPRARSCRRCRAATHRGGCGSAGLQLGPVHLAVVAVVAAARRRARGMVGRARPGPRGARRPGCVRRRVGRRRSRRSCRRTSRAARPAAGPVPGEELVVDVAGKVRRPGIAVLPAGVPGRRRAGGGRGSAARRRPHRAQPRPPGRRRRADPRRRRARPGRGRHASARPAPGGDALVNLNTADQAALETLPGVGPVTAEAILAWRTEHGGFTSVDELLEVDGIGEATLADLAPLVTL